MLPLRAHYVACYARGVHRGLHWQPPSHHCFAMKQASLTKFFTKGAAAGAAEAPARAAGAAGSKASKQTLTVVNATDKKRPLEVLPWA